MRTPMDELLGRTTHEDEFLFDEDGGGGPASAATIVNDAEAEGFADAPPEEADYRPADVEAVACWNCAHFQRTGVGDDNWPTGLCHLWEAKVQGEATCDRYTADTSMQPWPPHKHSGEGDNPDVEEYSGESSHLVEIFLSGDDDDLEVDETGLVKKAILRTGEWKKTPSSKGVIRKPLRVIRDGVSSAKDRIISLQEIKDNFDAGAYPNVPIPLTDEEKKDHKNLLRLNTGWIKKLWIEDLPNGMSKLVAGMQFTEPDAREKVKRGTYPDVSSGIFFGIERPDGKRFNSALNHVVITHKPFMDGLGGFQFSDDHENPETIESLVLADGEDEQTTPDWDDRLGYEARKEKVQLAIEEELDLPKRVEGEESNRYVVKDLMGDRALIFSEAGEVEYVAEFSLEDNEVKVSPAKDWQLREIEASQEDEQPEEPAVASEPTVPRNESPLQQARRRRADRVRHNQPDRGGVRQMAKIRDKSEVDFSNPEDAEKFAVELSEENSRLGKTHAESELETRIEELKEIGFEDMPGALAYYRDIFLSDDGEVAVVLLSHDDDGNETSRKSRTAKELIDGFIAAIPTDKEGKILLSGQGLDTGNNEPPPKEEVELSDEEYDNDKEKVEQRTSGVADALGVDLGDDKGKEE